MSIKLMSKVFEGRFDWGKDAPAESTIKLVLLALADHASDTGEAIYPSIAHVCAKTGLERKSVIRAMSAARAQGVLTAIGKRKQVIEYRMQIDQSPTVTGTSPLKSPVPVPVRDRTSPLQSPVIINEPPKEPSTESSIARAAQTRPPAPGSLPQSNSQKEMVGVLMKATGVVSGSRVARPASELIRAGLTPEKILAAYSPGGWWYAHDWRGKKGQRPTPQQIVDTAGLIESVDNGAPVVRAVEQPKSADALAEYMQRTGATLERGDR